MTVALKNKSHSEPTTTEATLKGLSNQRQLAFETDPENSDELRAFFDAVAPLLRSLPEDLVIGIDDLAEAQRSLLRDIKTNPLELTNGEGKPVNSIRRLAEHVGQSHTYIANYAKGEAFPCIVIMNAIADVMGMEFVVPNFDREKTR